MGFANQQVLVTGATGFLGGALALRLAVDGAQVRSLARSPQKADVLREKQIKVVEGDMTDADSLRRAVVGCRVVFHAAASFSRDYAKQRAVNIDGLRNLLDAAAEASAERFVYVSSIAVYGYRCAGDVTENTPPAPGADSYAIIKAEAESVVRAGSIPYTIVRPGMIYGAGAVNWTRNLFRLAQRNPTPFIGDGRGSAFPIHLDDVVDMLMIVAAHPAAANQIFNCAPDPSPTWREFLGAYSRLAGHDNWLAIPPLLVRPVAEIIRLLAPHRSMTRDLPDQLAFLQRQITFKTVKTRDLLGWSPRIDLDAGIAACAPWLREQELLA